MREKAASCVVIQNPRGVRLYYNLQANDLNPFRYVCSLVDPPHVPSLLERLEKGVEMIGFSVSGISLRPFPPCRTGRSVIQS